MPLNKNSIRLSHCDLQKLFLFLKSNGIIAENLDVSVYKVGYIRQHPYEYINLDDPLIYFYFKEAEYKNIMRFLNLNRIKRKNTKNKNRA